MQGSIQALLDRILNHLNYLSALRMEREFHASVMVESWVRKLDINTNKHPVHANLDN
jgi:hypothetical protein